MNDLAERTEQCPYCGESIDLLIDPSEMQQNYIEDCQVYCAVRGCALLKSGNNHYPVHPIDYNNARPLFPVQVYQSERSETGQVYNSAG